MGTGGYNMGILARTGGQDLSLWLV